MLVVTRKKEETILIGDNIEVTVVSSKDGVVKLAIKAPDDITILRKELLAEVKEENKKAISSKKDLLSILKK